jgi:4-hydroxy-3-methylbut-2-enyl diphosphate reductase
MDIILAKPRGFCAGVVRAVEIVESALELFGKPVYVLHEIVHNQSVVQRLRAKGAVFVEDFDDIPKNATAVFSAHGVAQELHRRAGKRMLNVIDATCPLVAKVHLEVARYAREGREVILIGHAGHPEIEGTTGQYDRSHGGDIYLVERAQDVHRLKVKNPEKTAYVTQTTLSVDDTAAIIDALRERYPNIAGPRKEDICYATQNRQSAVRRMAQQVDVLLVVGARNSSNSNRLREVGEHVGVRSYLIQDANELDPAWVRGCTSVGVSAGASAPEALVQDLLARLYTLGADNVFEMDGVTETVTFRLPEPLRVASGWALK